MSISSMESELIIDSFALMEGISLNKLGNNFHIKFFPIFTNSQSTITYLKDKINNSCTKHIIIHYHYTREQITARNIKLLS